MISCLNLIIPIDCQVKCICLKELFSSKGNHLFEYETVIRSSLAEVFCKKGVLKIFSKFKKHSLWYRCFSMNFKKFLRMHFFKLSSLVSETYFAIHSFLWVSKYDDLLFLNYSKKQTNMETNKQRIKFKRGKKPKR